jgi:hypothetical protein
MKNYLKPISADYYLKYICPKNTCKNEHWLSCKEAKVKGFKIVCDCGKVYSPLPIAKIKICYKKPKLNTYTEKKTSLPENLVVDEITHTPTEETFEQLQDRFTETMLQLGFDDKNEILEILDQAYKVSNTHDVATLFRIGVLNSNNLEK